MLYAIVSYWYFYLELRDNEICLKSHFLPNVLYNMQKNRLLNSSAFKDGYSRVQENTLVILIPNMTMLSVIGVSKVKIVPDKNGIMMPYNGYRTFSTVQ